MNKHISGFLWAICLAVSCISLDAYLFHAVVNRPAPLPVAVALEPAPPQTPEMSSPPAPDPPPAQSASFSPYLESVEFTYPNYNAGANGTPTVYLSLNSQELSQPVIRYTGNPDLQCETIRLHAPSGKKRIFRIERQCENNLEVAGLLLTDWKRHVSSWTSLPSVGQDMFYVPLLTYDEKRAFPHVPIQEIRTAVAKAADEAHREMLAIPDPGDNLLYPNKKEALRGKPLRPSHEITGINVGECWPRVARKSFRISVFEDGKWKIINRLDFFADNSMTSNVLDLNTESTSSDQSPKSKFPSSSPYLQSVEFTNLEHEEVPFLDFQDLSRPIKYRTDVFERIDGKTIHLRPYPGDSQTFKVERRFENTFYVADGDSQPLPLENWKRYVSPWKELPKVGPNMFSILRLSEKERACAPQATDQEIYAAIAEAAKAGGPSHVQFWLKIAHETSDITHSVVATKFSVRISVLENGKWKVIQQFDFFPTFGC
jgi:hypothetical protein